MIHGVLKIVFSRGSFSMRLQFSITICLSFFTAGWCVVTKSNSLSAVLCFCGLSVACLKSKVTTDKELSIYFFGYPRASRRRLKSARHSSNVAFEEFVLSSLIASPLIKPPLPPEGGTRENGYVVRFPSACSDF